MTELASIVTLMLSTVIADKRKSKISFRCFPKIVAFDVS